MTVTLSGQDVAKQITDKFPEAVIESNNYAAIIKNEYLLKVVEYLKNTPKLAFNYLTDLTCTDYLDYFEIIYHLSSMDNNTLLVLKVRCYDREKVELPSITGLFKGADYMEREIFDMMGIRFTGHPNMKRIFLWEGYQGYPLRKDFTGNQEK